MSQQVQQQPIEAAPLPGVCFAVIYRRRDQVKYRCRHFRAAEQAERFAGGKRSEGCEVAVDPNQPLSGWTEGEFICL